MRSEFLIGGNLTLYDDSRFSESRIAKYESKLAASALERVRQQILQSKLIFQIRRQELFQSLNAVREQNSIRKEIVASSEKLYRQGKKDLSSLLQDMTESLSGEKQLIEIEAEIHRLASEVRFANQRPVPATL
jgi:outer membrane protein TolC